MRSISLDIGNSRGFYENGYIYRCMKYQDFFEHMLPSVRKGDSSASNVDLKELKKGIQTEIISTKDERLARKIAMDHLSEDSRYYSKIAACGMDRPEPTFGGKSVSISVNGGHDTSPPSESGVSEPGDKSKITAAGKTDTSFAEKTVGGGAAPGEGQKQGGPNTKGNIAGTPKNSRIDSTSNVAGSKPTDQTIGVSGKKCTPKNPEISGDEEDSDMKINELKKIVKGEIKSVLKEMWLGWQEEDIEEGAAQYKVRDGRSYVEQPGLVNRAREIQYDPVVNETFKQRLGNMQSRLSEKCEFCGADDEINEVSPPGKEDWIKSNKDKFTKQYGKEKGMKVLYGKAWKDVSENQYKVRDGRSYVEQPGLVNRAREIQTDPNVAEAAYKVQGRSYREFEDSPQFPKACGDPKIA